MLFDLILMRQQHKMMLSKVFFFFFLIIIINFFKHFPSHSHIPKILEKISISSMGVVGQKVILIGKFQKKKKDYGFFTYFAESGTKCDEQHFAHPCSSSSSSSSSTSSTSFPILSHFSSPSSPLLFTFASDGVRWWRVDGKKKRERNGTEKKEKNEIENGFLPYTDKLERGVGGGGGGEGEGG